MCVRKADGLDVGNGEGGVHVDQGRLPCVLDQGSSPPRSQSARQMYRGDGYSNSVEDVSAK